MSLYKNLGFINHPFSKTNADEEPDLPDYFVPPPFFESIIGDSLTPNANVVLAPRGSGKTAQRIMLENYALETRFLAVTYDRFEFSSNQKVNNITLQYHTKNIIIRILISFISYLSEYPDTLKTFSKSEKNQLSLFIHNYLGDLNGDKLQELLKELKSLPEKFKDFWQKKIGFMDSLINYLLKTYKLEKIDLPDIKQEDKTLSQTYKYQIDFLVKFVKKLGFKSIYILIDRPDETEQTGNNAEHTYLLVKPMIKDLDLLGIEGIGFKFFLWDQVERFYRKDARPDRIPQYTLSWNRSSLQEVLSKRLKAFSQKKILNFDRLIDKKYTNYTADEIICLFSNGSPRNMIRICDRILAIQSELNSDTNIISNHAFEIGLLETCETIIRENYGETYLKEIQRVGRELFTINFVANDILKITANGARNKVTAWTKVGLVKLVGTVMLPPAKKPVNFYCVVDPMAVRLLHRNVPIETFLNDRWLPCEYCSMDNLIDINLYPEDNNPICRGCGRELI